MALMEKEREMAYEVKSTKGIERNMHEEIDNLVRKAYLEGFANGYKDCKEERGEHLWKQGVIDSWNTVLAIIDGLAQNVGKDNTLSSDKEVLEALHTLLSNHNPVYETEFYIQECDEDEEKYEPQTGDICLDPIGNECVIGNTDTHIHVIYRNKKTHKWDKSAEFKWTGKKGELW